MTEHTVGRRELNRAAIISMLTAFAAMPEIRTATAAPRPDAPADRTVIKQQLPGEPQRDLILVEVTYPPGTGSPPHEHANGVMAFVVAGSVVSKVGEAPEQTYHAGEAWYEPPGAIHRVSRNASSTDPATLLAIYLAPTGATAADLMKPI
jgi:quercetin dioxygenase-like cupin family protein